MLFDDLDIRYMIGIINTKQMHQFQLPLNAIVFWLYFQLSPIFDHVKVGLFGISLLVIHPSIVDYHES